MENNNFPQLKIYKNLIEYEEDIWFNLDNQFCVFKSINQKLNILVYYSNNQSLIQIFNLDNSQIIKSISFKENEWVWAINIRHYILNNKDVIILSFSNNIIKLFDIETGELLLKIENCFGNKNKFFGFHINSVCIIKEKNNNFFILGCNVLDNYIKIWNSNKEFIKTIYDKKLYYIDSYYSEKLNKTFVISSGGEGYIKSFDFENEQLFNKYKGEEKNKSFIIFKDNIIINCSSFVKIYNFYNANLIKNIDSEKHVELIGMCLYKEYYLFCGSDNGNIFLFDLMKGEKIKEISGHEYYITTVKIMKDLKNQDFLISHGYGKELIKLWKIE